MLLTYYAKILDLRFTFSFILLIGFLLSTSKLFAATSYWQGPYLGAYLGGGIGNSKISTDVGTVSSTSYFTSSSDINAVNKAGSSTHHPASLLTGIQAGHDWVSKKMVYGVIADYGAMSFVSSKSMNNQPYSSNSDQYSINTAISTNWLFTLRGRLGYQITLHNWPSFLYFTGGLAMIPLKVHNDFNDNSALAGTGKDTTTENQFGWTTGLGAEMATFKHASVNIEYLYVQVPFVNTTNSISNSAGGFGISQQSLTNSFTTTGKFYTNLLKISLNYRFDE